MEALGVFQRISLLTSRADIGSRVVIAALHLVMLLFAARLQALYYIVGDDKYAATPAQDRARTLIETSEKMIKELFEENGLPVSLSALGADDEILDKTVEETMKSYALVTNPQNVTKEDVYTILRSVM